jgi:hypothetical protein
VVAVRHEKEDAAALVPLEEGKRVDGRSRGGRGRTGRPVACLGEHGVHKMSSFVAESSLYRSGKHALNVFRFAKPKDCLEISVVQAARLHRQQAGRLHYGTRRQATGL